MTPDLGYCYNWLQQFHLGLPHFSRPLSSISHSWSGVLQFSLPVGFTAWLLFHAFYKRPLLALAPPSHRRRLAPVVDGFTNPSGWQWVGVAVSLVVGAMSHLGWDRFTHGSAWEMVAWLGSPALRAVAYGVLQIGSTLVALSYLAWSYRRWYAQAPVAPLALVKPDPCLRLPLVGCFLTAIAVAFVVLCLCRPLALWSFSFVYSNLERSIGSGAATGWILLTIFSGWWHLRRWVGPPNDSEPSPAGDPACHTQRGEASPPPMTRR